MSVPAVLTDYIPPSVSSDGNIRWAFVKTLANPAAPTVAELTAATTTDISCYLTASPATPTEVQTITDDRVCLKEALEKPGTRKPSIDNLTYIYDPQNPESISNKAYAALADGTTGYIVARYGLDVDTEWLAGQIVDVMPVEMGPQEKMPGTRNESLKVQQKPFITGKKQVDVVVV